ncbi:MAG: tryptophan--tRNA ligase, partial [Bacteroidaceae bacterium]
FMDIVSVPETVLFFEEKWNNCSIRYGDMKKQLAADIVNYTEPIRERIAEFSSNKALLDKIAREGAEKAQISASATLKEVRSTIGFRNLY